MTETAPALKKQAFTSVASMPLAGNAPPTFAPQLDRVSRPTYTGQRKESAALRARIPTGVRTYVLPKGVNHTSDASREHGPADPRLSRASAGRLSLYLRCLEAL